jgi:hypothetical protein
MKQNVISNGCEKSQNQISPALQPFEMTAKNNICDAQHHKIVIS